MIADVDASACKKTMRGKMLYVLEDMYAAVKRELENLGWTESRKGSLLADDERLQRHIHRLPAEARREAIEDVSRKPINSFNQPDFVKERVAVEVQFGKHALVARLLLASI